MENESMSEQATPPDADVGEPSPVSDAPSPWRRRGRLLWKEWVKPLIIIGTVMFSFRSAVADWNDVPTGSMKPTILEGDRIFINKVAYDLKFPFTTFRLMEWDDPIRGDIVVLRSPEDGKRLVKRVVGLPGDVLEVRGSRLFVNGEPVTYEELEASVIEQLDSNLRPRYFFANEVLGEHTHPVMMSLYSRPDPFGPFEVPNGKYFVMGDNRDNSRDSRWFGAVDRASILGQATAVALSVDRDAYFLPRWERFFSPLP